jgi:YcaO-like protein with predicted kinase domain
LPRPHRKSSERIRSVHVAPEKLTSLGPQAFESAVEITDAGHAKNFEETWEFLQELLPRVPVTRVYDTSPMDFIDLPVWQAVTPLAKDLTVHGGKGVSAIAAKLSAVMEAIERTSAEELPSRRVVTGSYRELAGSGAVDPERFALPVDTSYDADAVFSWTGAYDLMGGGYRLVPTDLVLNPAVEGMTSRIETNGLASGNTYTEAVLHALYELVERDAASEEVFYAAHHDPSFSPPRPPRSIDLDTIRSEAAQKFLRRLDDQGLLVRVLDLTSVTKVPVFRALIFDQSFFGQQGLSFLGQGADLDPARAVVRAITEACQSRSSFVTGARDVFEVSATQQRPATQKRLRSLRDLPGTLTFPEAEPGEVSRDILRNLHTVVDRLRAAGLEQCLVTELTREDLGIPVVRVLIPGLAFPYGESSRTPTLRMLESVI